MATARILIIDDDEDQIEAMSVVLTNKGYQVNSALSGDEGLKKAKSEKPDLVLLDVMMETNDKGFEVARGIRSDPSLAKTPILMLTAIREKTGFDFGREAGDEAWLPVDDYAEKPLRPDVLLTKVEKLLQR